MDIFEQNKLFKRLVIFLAVLNIAAVGAMVWNNTARHGNGPPTREDYHDVSGLLQKELNLSSAQVEKMKTLRKYYFDKESLLSENIKGERDSMNVIMFNKQSDSVLIQSLARKIAEHEYQMELLRFEQAQQLKTICTPEQLEKFEHLVIEIRDYFRPDNKPKHP